MKAIILAGGSGVRLWPVSRYGLPKQFMKLNGGKSLLCRTIERLSKVCPLKDIYIVTNKDYEFHVKEDLKSVSAAIEDNIILEPVGRNTAPAIALVMKYCVEKLKCPKDEVIFVCPSDHIIKPVEKFARYAQQARDVASRGHIVTFGVIPDKPETGYGYIKKGGKIAGHRSPVTSHQLAGTAGEVYRVEKFTEKPDLKTAEKYVKSRNYYWNSGMFAFTIKDMLAEFKRHVPGIYRKMSLSLKKMTADFKNMPDISIDYAVMEKSSRAAVLPLKLLWSDIGSWDSLPGISDMDENGNIKTGDILAIDTKNSIIIGEKRLISLVGMKNVTVIDTEDALLVLKKGDAQRVKDVVGFLKENRRKEIIEHTTAYRPWGNFKVLEEGPRYKIKRIVVKPLQRSSHQLHHHRSEHWIVIKGLAKVSIGRKESFVHENESTYVPKSTLHCLENPGKVPLEVIEVQNGEYVEDDDVIMYDEIYGRKNKRHAVLPKA
ncbi:MAG: mannose-1-phosphate guanylyltransferase/mannose-6-phosphate isomerase [Elusimicrobia bacterium]|nr:mannose-1-phosphate guanylyltransferase/mannose-6-phosphate isomerase [Elusimicrobiota bacterium]